MYILRKSALVCAVNKIMKICQGCEDVNGKFAGTFHFVVSAEFEYKGIKQTCLAQFIKWIIKHIQGIQHAISLCSLLHMFVLYI